MRRPGSESATGTEAGENDESRGTWEHPGDNHHPDTAHKPPGFVQRLRQQFREVANLLSQPAPTLTPKPRRRRTTDETGRIFRMAARKIMRRATRIPAAAYAVAEIPPGIVDWLNPWQGHDTAGTNEFEHFQHRPPAKHIYPHL